jgi:DNA-binding IclR family transcriptional regulator
MTTVTCLLATLLAVITVPLLILYLVTESRPQRARRWRRAGMTQQAIAQRLGCSRTTVRRMLAS